MGGLEPIPAVIGQEAEYTLNRSPVPHKQPSTLTLTPRVNVESQMNLTCMFLDGGRKPEYPEIPRIHGENMQTPHRKAPAGI